MAETPVYSARDRRLAVLGGVCVVFIMAGFVVMSRSGMRAAIDAQDLTFFRYASGVLFLPWFLRKSPLTLGGIGWRRGLFLTVCAGAPFNLMLVGGFAFAPAAHGGVFGPGTMPMVTVLLAWLVLGFKPSLRRIMGIAVLVGGLAVLGGGGLLESGPEAWKGDLMFLGGAFLWACFTVAIRAWNVDPVHAIVIVAVVSFAAFAPYYLIRGDGIIFTAGPADYWFQAFYQATLVGVGATILFTRAIPILGPARTVLINTTIPVVAVLLAIPILGEIPGPIEFAGMALVVLGMLTAMEIGFSVARRSAETIPK